MKPAARCLVLFFLAYGWMSCSRESETQVIKEGAGRVFIPDALLFAGEKVPVQEPDIRERLEKELLVNRYWYSSTSQWLRRSVRWFPIIDSVLKKNGVPADFRYLVAIESGFENVVSPKGATGFWQIMEATGLEYGLVITPEIDERLDPEKAGEAACKLLKRGHDQLHSWSAASVSYNVGIQGLKSVMNAQYTDSFYDVLINQESSRYLFRILAAKLILENPEKYGFEKPKPVPAYQWKNQEISEPIPDLPWWCRRQGFSYKCFRLLNPWIKTSRLKFPDGMSSVKVKMPVNCGLFTSLQLPEEPVNDSLASGNESIEANLVQQKDVKKLKSDQSRLRGKK